MQMGPKGAAGPPLLISCKFSLFSIQIYISHVAFSFYQFRHLSLPPPIFTNPGSTPAWGDSFSGRVCSQSTNREKVGWGKPKHILLLYGFQMKQTAKWYTISYYYHDYSAYSFMSNDKMKFI